MDTNAPPPPPPPPPAAHRALRRDRADGMLGGVAAGISRTYGIDVLLVRVLFVIAGVLWIGVPAYIVAWIAIAPTDGPPTFTPGRRDPKMILGLALVALGALIAGDRVLPHGLGFGHYGGPLLLIGGGLAILLLRRRDDPRPQDAADPPPAGPPPPDEPAAEEPTETAPVDEPTTSFLPPAPPVPPSAWTQHAPWPIVSSTPSARARRREWRHERRAQRPRSFLTPLTLSVLLIGAGVAGLLQTTGALDVNLTIVLALGTCIVGVVLVTAAFFGRAHSLVLVGLVLLAATGIANTIDVPLRGGVGNHEYRPLQLSELQTRYETGIGKLVLDFRDVPLTGRTTTIEARTGIGELLVDVPSAVRVEVHAHTGAGAVTLFDNETHGGWPENDQRAVDGSGPGVLRLNLRVGAGQIRVRRFEPGGIETIVGGN